MRRWAVAVGVVMLGLAGLSALACGGAAGAEPNAGDGTTVAVGLKEFAIDLDRKDAPAGAATFKTTNKGTTPHELVVIKTDLAADRLAVKDRSVDASGLTVLGAITELASARSASQTFELTAGKYVLICNLPAHYQAGMRTAFTVQ